MNKNQISMKCLVAVLAPYKISALVQSLVENLQEGPSCTGLCLLTRAGVGVGAAGDSGEHAASRLFPLLSPVGAHSRKAAHCEAPGPAPSPQLAVAFWLWHLREAFEGCPSEGILAYAPLS